MRQRILESGTFVAAKEPSLPQKSPLKSKRAPVKSPTNTRVRQRILESGTFVAAHSGPQMAERELSGLVLSPTRELALQVRNC